jgi:hypothetical protein
MIDPAPRTTRLARLTRWLGLDRNPLRRSSDRAETSVIAALLAAFLIGAPITAVAAYDFAHAAVLRTEQAQRGSHSVPAVLLEAAPKNRSFMYQSAAFVWVRARWAAPNGSATVGEIPVAGGTRAGSTVHIWVDGSGRLAYAPLTTTQIIDRVVAAAIFAPIALAVVLVSMAAVARRLFERRRLAEWASAWEAIEPQWTHRG